MNNHKNLCVEAMFAAVVMGLFFSASSLFALEAAVQTKGASTLPPAEQEFNALSDEDSNLTARMRKLKKAKPSIAIKPFQYKDFFGTGNAVWAYSKSNVARFFLDNGFEPRDGEAGADYFIEQSEASCSYDRTFLRGTCVCGVSLEIKKRIAGGILATVAVGQGREGDAGDFQMSCAQSVYSSAVGKALRSAMDSLKGKK